MVLISLAHLGSEDWCPSAQADAFSGSVLRTWTPLNWIPSSTWSEVTSLSLGFSSIRSCSKEPP